MLEIRPATTDDDLAELAHLVSTVLPDDPTSVEEMRWADTAYPGGRRFLAWIDGVAVGTGDVGRVYMTAVVRDWRGRGVATALKRATIEWAIARGLDELGTANDTVNAPMRAVNRRLGYRPLPDDIDYRGPLWPGRPEQRETPEPPPRYVTATPEGLDR